ncbi:MAG: glucosaminidase domain-containing protein [Bacteroidales bacterium]|jgi:flagellum-specific peptidoglycan hydrolase FlgJ|nr:glucosaminidase domain-containing protein [Bacteroidales bacterium]
MKNQIALTILMIFSNFLFSQNGKINIDSVPVNIIGEGIMTESDLLNFYSFYASQEGDLEKIKRIIPIYLEEAKIEKINHDIAFAQMILETGYLRYKGIVKKEQNNFCGLGAINKSNVGHYFTTEANGVRAHIQHLKAYASEEQLQNKIIDPRYDFVVPKGKAATIDKLTGTWATDKDYSAKIKNILVKMYEIKNSNSYLDQYAEKQVSL